MTLMMTTARDRHCTAAAAAVVTSRSPRPISAQNQPRVGGACTRATSNGTVISIMHCSGTVRTGLAILTERTKAGAVLGKNIWGAWPLIIWEATIVVINVYKRFLFLDKKTRLLTFFIFPTFFIFKKR